MEIVILGAGIAGIAAAYRLKEAGLSSVIYEQEDTYGGLCNSFRINGFTFDTFAHISFDVSTRKWLEDKTECLIHEPEALNYDNGRWLRHPVQNNLIGLPVEERIGFIKSFIERPKADGYGDYGQWLRGTYGNKFAEQYPYKYTRKYWTVEPELLETQWVQGRMYEPTLEDVLRGSMVSETPGVHYSKKANYPKKGGFKAFLAPMAEGCHIECGKRVQMIDVSHKKVYFEDSSEVQYDKLISTIPLPDLCRSIMTIPESIREAADRLDYTSGVMVSIGLSKPCTAPALWFYIYDEDILPARVYAPDIKSPDNVPEGCSALQAEIYYSKYRKVPDDLEQLKKDVIRQLLKLELFTADDIVVSDIRMKQYANIMFTPSIYEARDQIHQYLKSMDIEYAGRWGEWDYLWVGQSLLSGRSAVGRYIEQETGFKG